MSSSATPLSKKRTHSSEQGGERSGPNINAKKPRTSSETPSSRPRRKRARKRAVPVVEDIAGSSSTRSHNDGGELMTPEIRHYGGHHRKPRRVAESDEEDTNIAPWPTPHSQVTQQSQLNDAPTSSSPSLKGKERLTDPASIVSTSNIEDLSKKTEDLNEKLDVQTTKLAIHSALISSFKESLTCQICVDLMYKPFTLAPCGHIACYSCLVGWFKSNVGEEEFGPHSVHRRKTCPHCRSAVRDRPIENFTIKEMVNSLVNSGVLEDVSGATTATNDVPATSADPWVGIFPKHPVMENNYDGLPFRLWDEGEDEDPDYEEGDMGIRDEEDDVYRCRGCMNEVVDGFCTMCERQYQPAWAAGQLLGDFFGGYADRLWGIDGDSDSDEGEEHFQEGYEESFIDDDEGVGDDPELYTGPLTPPSYHGDEEDEEEVVEIASPAVARLRNRQAPIVISSDEEDDEYTDADTHGDYGQVWNGGEDEEGGYHDARSDSDDHGDVDYTSDDGHSFYGYL